MGQIIVDVMPKREILDPQGQAIVTALPTLDVTGIADVRQGKHFVIEVDGEADDAALATVRKLAERLLANPVIEDYVIHRAP